MEFLTSLLTVAMCIGGAFLLLLYVGSFVLIANSLDKIAKVFVKWYGKE